MWSSPFQCCRRRQIGHVLSYKTQKMTNHIVAGTCFLVAGRHDMFVFILDGFELLVISSLLKVGKSINCVCRSKHSKFTLYFLSFFVAYCLVCLKNGNCIHMFYSLHLGLRLEVWLMGSLWNFDAAYSLDTVFIGLHLASTWIFFKLPFPEKFLFGSLLDWPERTQTF